MGYGYWDSETIFLSVAGEEIVDFVDFAYANGKNSKHITSTNKGPTGYSTEFAEPTFQITLNATSTSLSLLNSMKNNNTHGNLMFKAPGLVIKGFTCAITDINPGRFSDGSPSVVVTGKALKIDDEWGPEQVDRTLN